MTVPKWAGAGASPGTARVVLGHSGLPAPIAARRARAWLTYPILVILFAFMGPYSLHPAAATGNDAKVGAGAAAAGSSVEQGTQTRQMAIVLLAAFAGLTLSAGRRRRSEAARLAAAGHYRTASDRVASSYGAMSTSVLRLLPRGLPGAGVETRSAFLLLLLIAYVGLASASVMWAGDSVLAAKRAVVFLVFVFTAFALAQVWSLRELLFFSMFASGTSLTLGVAGALARGDFQPLSADYRFVGFANPNQHGIEAVCLVIAAAIALRFTKRRLPMLAVLVFGLGMLLLTKSRTALAALLLAGAVVALLSVRRNRLATMAIVVVALVFAVVAFAPDSVFSRAQDAVLLGRSAEAESPATLSGRTLLWEDLLHFAADRPLLGYGFDSFWTPAHIAAVSVRRGWVITQSHSGYVEALLNVGWIGAGLLVLLLVTGLVTAIRRYRGSHTALALFAVAMLTWYMTNLLAEAIPESHISTLIIMVVLAHLAMRNAAPDDSELLGASG